MEVQEVPEVEIDGANVADVENEDNFIIAFDDSPDENHHESDSSTVGESTGDDTISSFDMSFAQYLLHESEIYRVERAPVKVDGSIPRLKIAINKEADEKVKFNIILNAFCEEGLCDEDMIGTYLSNGLIYHISNEVFERWAKESPEMVDEKREMLNSIFKQVQNLRQQVEILSEINTLRKMEEVEKRSRGEGKFEQLQQERIVKEFQQERIAKEFQQERLVEQFQLEENKVEKVDTENETVPPHSDSHICKHGGNSPDLLFQHCPKCKQHTTHKRSDLAAIKSKRDRIKNNKAKEFSVQSEYINGHRTDIVGDIDEILKFVDPEEYRAEQNKKTKKSRESFSEKTPRNKRKRNKKKFKKFQHKAPRDDEDEEDEDNNEEDKDNDDDVNETESDTGKKSEDTTPSSKVYDGESNSKANLSNALSLEPDVAPQDRSEKAIPEEPEDDKITNAKTPLVKPPNDVIVLLSKEKDFTEQNNGKITNVETNALKWGSTKRIAKVTGKEDTGIHAKALGTVNLRQEDSQNVNRKVHFEETKKVSSSADKVSSTANRVSSSADKVSSTANRVSSTPLPKGPPDNAIVLQKGPSNTKKQIDNEGFNKVIPIMKETPKTETPSLESKVDTEYLQNQDFTKQNNGKITIVETAKIERPSNYVDALKWGSTKRIVKVTGKDDTGIRAKALGTVNLKQEDSQNVNQKVHFEEMDKVSSTSDKASSTADKASSIANRVSSIANEASSTPDKASSTPDKASSTPDKASSTPDKASSTADKASSTPDKASSIANKASSIANEASSIANEASSIANEVYSTPLPKGPPENAIVLQKGPSNTKKQIDNEGFNKVIPIMKETPKTETPSLESKVDPEYLKNQEPEDDDKITNAKTPLVKPPNDVFVLLSKEKDFTEQNNGKITNVETAKIERSSNYVDALKWGSRKRIVKVTGKDDTGIRAKALGTVNLKQEDSQNVNQKVHFEETKKVSSTADKVSSTADKVSSTANEVSSTPLPKGPPDNAIVLQKGPSNTKKIDNEGFNKVIPIMKETPKTETPSLESKVDTEYVKNQGSKSESSGSIPKINSSEHAKPVPVASVSFQKGLFYRDRVEIIKNNSIQKNENHRNQNLMRESTRNNFKQNFDGVSRKENSMVQSQTKYYREFTRSKYPGIKWKTMNYQNSTGNYGNERTYKSRYLGSVGNNYYRTNSANPIANKMEAKNSKITDKNNDVEDKSISIAPSDRTGSYSCNVKTPSLSTFPVANKTGGRNYNTALLEQKSNDAHTRIFIASNGTEPSPGSMGYPNQANLEEKSKAEKNNSKSISTVDGSTQTDFIEINGHDNSKTTNKETQTSCSTTNSGTQTEPVECHNDKISLQTNNAISEDCETDITSQTESTDQRVEKNKDNVSWNPRWQGTQSGQRHPHWVDRSLNCQNVANVYNNNRATLQANNPERRNLFYTRPQHPPLMGDPHFSYYQNPNYPNSQTPIGYYRGPNNVGYFDNQANGNIYQPTVPNVYDGYGPGYVNTQNEMPAENFIPTTSNQMAQNSSYVSPDVNPSYYVSPDVNPQEMNRTQNSYYVSPDVNPSYYVSPDGNPQEYNRTQNSYYVPPDVNRSYYVSPDGNPQEYNRTQNSYYVPPDVNRSYYVSPDGNPQEYNRTQNSYYVPPDVNRSYYVSPDGNPQEYNRTQNSYYVPPDVNRSYYVSPDVNPQEMNRNQNSYYVSPDVNPSYYVSPDVNPQEMNRNQNSYYVSPDVNPQEMNRNQNPYYVSPDVNPSYYVSPDVNPLKIDMTQNYVLPEVNADGMQQDAYNNFSPEVNTQDMNLPQLNQYDSDSYYVPSEVNSEIVDEEQIEETNVLPDYRSTSYPQNLLVKKQDRLMRIVRRLIQQSYKRNLLKQLKNYERTAIVRI